MNIAFDAKRAISNFTGLGNYSRSSIRALISYFPNNNYFLYTPNFSINSRIDIIRSMENTHIELPKSFIHQLFKAYWRLYGLKNDLLNKKIEIYHGLSHEIPFGLKKIGIKSVVTIHDLVYIRYPHLFSFFDRKIYDIKFRYACANADKIVAISEQTKDDIIHFFKVDEKKIEVVYQSCDPVFSETIAISNLDKVRIKYNLPAKFILNVGTVEERKNIELGIKAMKGVSADCHLVIIGRKTKYQKKLILLIKELGLENRIIFLPKVSLKDLPSIYTLSKLFIYPSKFEGFGIPIIEAMQCGIPVISSNSCGCLREAGGEKSLYVNSDDANELCEKINLVLNNSEIAKDMSTSGLEHVQKFSEKKSAQYLMEIYSTLCDERGNK